MAWRKAKEDVAPAVEHTGKSLVASAARLRLDGQGIRTWRFGDDSWQQEAWRLYDIIGELRFTANWIGSALSRVRIYVANVDKNGRVQDEVKTGKVSALADNLFGGPAGLAEALRMIGINLTIAGDVYIVAKGGGSNGNDGVPEGENWMVLSCNELKRWGPGNQNIAWLYGDNKNAKETLDPNTDLIIRVWTPHPRRMLWADSPTRGAMPMLWEIERLTRYVFAQIDSRLVSAGLMPIPKEVSFPDEDPQLSGAEQLTQRLMRTGQASLKGEGTAAGVVPTFVEMPTDALGKLQLIQFTSELSKQALDLRSEAIRRFGLAMDIDPNILTGIGEANHWGAWQVMEGQIKVHIEPLITRICDGLSAAYLKPALKIIGQDPDRFVFWFDTAPLTVRPERLKDTQELYRDGIVSKAAVLLSGDYKLTDAPSPEEELQKFTRDLMLRDPNLFANPAVRKVAGYTEDILPSNASIQIPGTGAGPAPPPAPPTGITSIAGTSPPENSTAQNALGGPGGNASPAAGSPPTGVTAASQIPAAMNVFMVANATVLRAMERASKRMLTRQTVGQFPETPGHELHTRLPVQPDANFATSLLDGSWDQLPILASLIDSNMDTTRLRQALEQYCCALLVHRQAHNVELLGEWLRSRGLLNGEP